MQKDIVVCPNCEKLKGGIRGINILGRIESDGGFLILRFHSAKTIIYGDNFRVVCGNCKEIVYIHTERNHDENFNLGTVRVYREPSFGSVIKIGTSNNPITSGTVI